jgi:hypothetical protein
MASTLGGRPRPHQQHAARTAATSRAASWPLAQWSGGVLRSDRERWQCLRRGRGG